MEKLLNLEFDDNQILKTAKEIKNFDHSNIIDSACDILNACACDCACRNTSSFKHELDLEFNDGEILRTCNDIGSIVQKNIKADACDIRNACSHDCNCGILKSFDIKSDLELNDSLVLTKVYRPKQNVDIAIQTGACSNQTPVHDRACSTSSNRDDNPNL